MSAAFASGELEKLQWERPGPEVLWILLSRVIPQTQGEDQSPHCRQLLLPHSQMFACLLRFFFHALGYHLCISSDRTLLSLKIHRCKLFFSLLTLFLPPSPTCALTSPLSKNQYNVNPRHHFTNYLLVFNFFYRESIN